jgi:hypothetical protein
LVFPDPVRATAPQPEIALVPFLNATLPVGAYPFAEHPNKRPTARWAFFGSWGVSDSDAPLEESH